MDNLNLSSEEEVGKVDEIPSTNGDPPKQTKNDINLNKGAVLLKLTLMTTYQDSMSFGN